jgi:hypothetical protein
VQSIVSLGFQSPNRLQINHPVTGALDFKQHTCNVIYPEGVMMVESLSTSVLVEVQTALNIVARLSLEWPFELQRV